MLALIAAFIVVPILEIWLIIQVGQTIGALWTVALLLTTSIVGAALAKVAGFSVLNRIRQQLALRQMPTNELIDGALVVTGGILMMVPGFSTDILGLALLFPPTRLIARGIVKRRFAIVSFTDDLGGVIGDVRRDRPDDVIDI